MQKRWAERRPATAADEQTAIAEAAGEERRRGSVSLMRIRWRDEGNPCQHRKPISSLCVTSCDGWSRTSSGVCIGRASWRLRRLLRSARADREFRRGARPGHGRRAASLPGQRPRVARWGSAARCAIARGRCEFCLPLAFRTMRWPGVGARRGRPLGSGGVACRGVRAAWRAHRRAPRAHGQHPRLGQFDAPGLSRGSRRITRPRGVRWTSAPFLRFCPSSAPRSPPLSRQLAGVQKQRVNVAFLSGHCCSFSVHQRFD